MLLFTGLASFWFTFSAEWASIGRQSFAALISLANFEMWEMAGNYWGVTAERAPLLHTWSLSVEEQYYLLYPTFLLITYKYFSRSILLWFGLGVIASFLISCYASYNHPSAGFYLLPFRVWELLAGGMLFIFENRRRQHLRELKFARWATIFGVLLLASSYFVISEETIFPGLWGALPVFGTLLILAFSGAPNCTATKLLSHGSMILIGKLSYSLYLWHWPVIVFAKRKSEGQQIEYPNLAIVVIIFSCLSVISYYFIENPVRRSRSHVGWITIPAIVSLLISVILIKIEKTYDTSHYNLTVWNGGKYDVTPDQGKTRRIVEKRMRGISSPQRSIEHDDAYKKEGIVSRNNDDRMRVGVLGDSHALMWCGVIDAVCADLEVGVTFFAANGTNPFIDFPLKRKGTFFFSAHEKLLFDKARLEFIKQKSPDIVIIATPWSGIKDPLVVSDLLSYLNKNNIKVLMLEEPPRLAIGDVNAPQFAAYMDGGKSSRPENLYIPETNKENHAKGQRLLKRLIQEYHNTTILPIIDLYKNHEGKVLLREGSNILYTDDDHLSEFGAGKAKARIFRQLNLWLNENSEE